MNKPTFKLTTLFVLPLALATSACDSKKQASNTKAEAAAKAQKEEAGAKAKKAPEAKAPPQKPEPYLSSALSSVASGKACEPSDTKPYGCSVKYGEGEGEAKAKVGEDAPDFELKDLEGKNVKLSSFRGKTVVLEWFNPDCPFVKYAHAQGPLKEIATQQAEAGVVWIAINSGAPGKQGHGVELNKKASEQWAMKHPILLDENGQVGRSYGAKTTPHVYVINPEGKLAYRGAVDNAPLGEVKG